MSCPGTCPRFNPSVVGQHRCLPDRVATWVHLVTESRSANETAAASGAGSDDEAAGGRISLAANPGIAPCRTAESLQCSSSHSRTRVKKRRDLWPTEHALLDGIDGSASCLASRWAEPANPMRSLRPDVERGWFTRTLLRAPNTPPMFHDPAVQDSGMVPLDGADHAADLTVWQQECARSQQHAARFELDDAGLRDGQECSLRWIYTHMIEEYARHNGHADRGAAGW